MGPFSVKTLKQCLIHKTKHTFLNNQISSSCLFFNYGDTCSTALNHRWAHPISISTPGNVSAVRIPHVPRYITSHPAGQPDPYRSCVRDRFLHLGVAGSDWLRLSATGARTPGTPDRILRGREPGTTAGCRSSPWSVARPGLKSQVRVLRSRRWTCTYLRFTIRVKVALAIWTSWWLLRLRFTLDLELRRDFATEEPYDYFKIGFREVRFFEIRFVHGLLCGIALIVISTS